jgi:hypothetical protein
VVARLDRQLPLAVERSRREVDRAEQAGQAMAIQAKRGHKKWHTEVGRLYIIVVSD